MLSVLPTLITLCCIPLFEDSMSPTKEAVAANVANITKEVCFEASYETTSFPTESPIPINVGSADIVDKLVDVDGFMKLISQSFPKNSLKHQVTAAKGMRQQFTTVSRDGSVTSKFKFDQDKLVLLDKQNGALNIMSGDGSFSKISIWSINDCVPVVEFLSLIQLGKVAHKSGLTVLRSENGDYSVLDSLGRLHARLTFEEKKQKKLYLLTYAPGSSSQATRYWMFELTEDWKITNANIKSNITCTPASCEKIDAAVLEVPAGITLVDSRLDSEKPKVVKLERRYDDSEDAVQLADTKGVIKLGSKRNQWLLISVLLGLALTSIIYLFARRRNHLNASRHE
jgi:hypothetical protein